MADNNMLVFIFGFTAGSLIVGALVFLWRNIEMARISERLDAERSTNEKLRTDFRQISVEAAMSMNQQIKSDAGQAFQRQEQAIANSVADMKTRFDETQKALKKFDEERAVMFGRLEQSLGQVLDAGQSIKMEASSLKKALTSSSGIRGEYGQIVLQNILEQSGLVRGVDFSTQSTVTGENSGDLRPDFVINLPSGRRLAIDAKEVAGEYLLAQETDDANKQKEHFIRLAANVRSNISRLGQKNYQQYVDPEIPFVLMFIPNEAAIRTAIATDPQIYEDSRKKQIYLASPMTIMPIIYLIRQFYHQQQVATNARELAVVVEDLGNRLKTFVTHLNDMRSGVQKASESWDKVVGSWQKNVKPQIERTKSLGGPLKDVPEIETLNANLRPLPDVQ